MLEGAPWSPGATTEENAPSPIFIDLETRSAADIKKGGRQYAAHPTTEILTVVAMIDDLVVAWSPLLATPLNPEKLWPNGFGEKRKVASFAGRELPAPLAAAIQEERPFCAHNAFDFDSQIWRAAGHPEPSVWLDTLPDVRAAGLPGKLDEVGQYLFGKGKDGAGEELINKFCIPDKQGRFRPMTPDDTAALLRYNVGDVLLLSKLYNHVKGNSEPEVVALDRVINQRGIYIDQDLARKLLNLEKLSAPSVAAQVEAATNSEIKASDLTRTAHLRKWLKKQGLVLPDLKRETVLKVLQGGENLKPAVVAVLEARLASGRVTTSKLETALEAVDDDSRLRHMLVYHKAHTGRWSGCKLQPHNLPKPHEDIKELWPLLEATGDLDSFQKVLPAGVSLSDGISSLIRPCLKAAPGKGP